MKRWVYVTLCTSVWLVPQAVAAVQFPVPEAVLWLLGIQVLALLTYPAGAIGILTAMTAVFFGIVTPIESLFISGPISLAAGYLQSFVVVPRFFGSAGS
jgi:hypothetical protein